MNMDKDAEVAVLHGNYFQRAGGEIVADAIAEAFDAPLFYGFGDPEVMPDDDIDRRPLFDMPRLHALRLKGVVKSVYQLRDLCFFWWGHHLPELTNYDVVIQSGNELGWYVPPDDQVIVKYVHSPPRNAYDRYQEVGGDTVHTLYTIATRTLYTPTTSYPDRYLANSELVARRIRRYWGQASTVVYPPVDCERLSADRRPTDPDLFLTFNRLVRHKRTREIVKAFADLPDKRLVVGGDGPELETLRKIAPSNVEVRGYLDEDDKRDLLSEAAALVFNAVNEDFGLIPVEAFASGTPVVGVSDGFTAYQIADGVNGVLYPDHSADAVRHGVERFVSDGVRMDGRSLEQFASHFSTDRFKRQVRRHVAETVEEAAVKGIRLLEDERPTDASPVGGHRI